MMRSLLIVPLFLALGACAETGGSKARFDSPLFARSPELHRAADHYVVAIYPKDNWSVSVAAVATDFKNGRIIIYASKLQRATAASPQLFTVNIPASVDPATMDSHIFWQDPNGWVTPLPIAPG